MNNYSRNVLDQNITGTVLARSREEIIQSFKQSAQNIKNEFVDTHRETIGIVTKAVHAKMDSNDLIKRLRHVAKHQIFEKWIDTDFIEQKNTEIITKIINEWDKKQSSQRRDLNELFKFLKSQDISMNYKRVIEANRTSKYVDFEEVRFLYNHPSIEISDSMRYILTRNEFYFYKNFEMLLILSTSFQKNEDVRNTEISAMRNLTGSLYYKLLSYSKHLTTLISCLRENSISPLSSTFKHALILEQLKSTPEKSQNSTYKILPQAKIKTTLKNFVEILEKLECVLNVNVTKEREYFSKIVG